MTQVDYRNVASTALRGDLSASDKHCVFRSGASWYSLPAISVREITIAPPMVGVPLSHRALAGLCHLRSEFIPVLALSTLLEIEDQRTAQSNNKLMVMSGTSSSWALLIAEAAALESLETIMSPESRLDDSYQSPVMGTAMYQDQIVRVLDPNRLFRLAQQTLDTTWSRQHVATTSNLS
jgi:chemotaxis signal transduction protein